VLQVEANRDDSCMEVTALRRSSGMRTTPILNRTPGATAVKAHMKAKVAIISKLVCHI
jgi:hypothetical protein